MKGVPPSGSGLRPDGLSQSPLSQAEPLVPNAERWGIDGNWPYFTIEPAGVEQGIYGCIAINGEFGSKLEALEHLVRNLEDTRHQLSGEIAKHKRALRRALATEARRAETTKIGSVHEGAGPKDNAHEQ